MTEYYYFKCPTCFVNWDEGIEGAEEQKVGCEFKLCDFCKNNHTSLEILKRQVEVMPKAHPSDFPQFIERLITHLDLKDF